MKFAQLHFAQALIGNLHWPQAHCNGRWTYSRPLPLYSIINHLHATWLVFTGRADALIWEDGQ